jgi:uncharacterized membrane protein YeaQ/YmgE (transglycosylase-associated protein family)
MIVVGFVVGLIARFLMPGVDHMGFWLTSGLGIVGSFVGGFISQLFSKSAGGGMTLRPAGFLLSIVGALIVLFLCNLIVRH